jgi:hypothetical protein
MQLDPGGALELLNTTARSFTLSEADVVEQLQRTCIDILDDAALCNLVTAFCKSSDHHMPELAVLSAITNFTFANRINSLKNPASRQLFAAFSSLVRCFICSSPVPLKPFHAVMFEVFDKFAG